MKKTIFLLTLACCTIIANAQGPNPGMNELKEKVIGWDKIMQPNGNARTKAAINNGRTYSNYQFGLIDTFSSWIKKSYIPIGGLPQQERLALPDAPNSRPYVPIGSGVSMGMWVPCYDKTGKGLTRAQPASADRITILTNHLKAYEEASWYNTPTQYYFTMCMDTRGKYFDAASEQKVAPFREELNRKISGNYMIYTSAGVRTMNILMIPGGELPLIQLTKREILDKGEECVKRANAKKDLPDHMLQPALDNIRDLRNKYKNSLDEPAIINHMQLGIYSFEKDADLFDMKKREQYPWAVYKYKPEVYELAKNDKPVWLNITFDYATEKSSTCAWEIYKAMTTNFNYEYVYNYFFNPEKVKGKSYQPLKPVTTMAAEDKVKNKAAASSQIKTFPQGVFYMEDFADATSGTMPAGWSSEQSNRTFQFEKISEQSANWMLLDDNSAVFPSAIKKNFPQDFTLTFDIATSDFTEKSGRSVQFFLDGNSPAGKRDVGVKLTLSPGHADLDRVYPSTAVIAVRTPANYDAKIQELEFNTFNNVKNVVHIKVVKKGTSLKIFANDLQVKADAKYGRDYDAEMKLPDNTTFTNISWRGSVFVQQRKEGNVYLSNVRIINTE